MCDDFASRQNRSIQLRRSQAVNSEGSSNLGTPKQLGVVTVTREDHKSS
jgi:hypothetical protein